MKKLLIWLSLSLNVLVVSAVVLAANGSLVSLLSPLIVKYIIEPNHERSVSQFELVSVQPGDVVFLGDSITAGGS